MTRVREIIETTTPATSAGFVLATLVLNPPHCAYTRLQMPPHTHKNNREIKPLPRHPRRYVAIPDEVVDDIVSLVHLDWDICDYGVLSYASLVCRQWARVTRPYRFHLITIKDVDRLKDLFRYLVNTPQIGEWIQVLHFVGPDLPGWPALWAAPRMLDVLQRLSALRALVFKNIGGYGASPAISDPKKAAASLRRLSKCTSIQSVSISNSNFRAASVIKLLGSLPNVKHVSLDVFYPTEDTSPKSTLNLPSLKSLSIGYRSSGISQILSLETIQQVECLKLVGSERLGTSTDLPFVLRNLGSSFKSLEVPAHRACRQSRLVSYHILPAHKVHSEKKHCWITFGTSNGPPTSARSASNAGPQTSLTATYASYQNSAI